MIRIVFLTSVVVSLFCITIAIYSGHLLQVLKGLSEKGPGLLTSIASILCILEICYSFALSFIFFVIWDVHNNLILYQTIVFLLVTLALLYIFYKLSKNKMMVILSVIWCGLMTFYMIYLFNQFFLLV